MAILNNQMVNEYKWGIVQLPRLITGGSISSMVSHMMWQIHQVRPLSWYSPRPNNVVYE